MIWIETSVRRDRVIFAVIGRIESHNPPVILDLKGVTLVDCDVVTFLMSLDWDGKIRMDCSSPHAMAKLIGLKDRFDIAFGNDTTVTGTASSPVAQA